jgi:hypothetical protein
MLTKIEGLQTSENLKNHSAKPMIFAGSMRCGGMLQKRELNRQTGAFAVGRPAKWNLAAIVGRPSST